MARNLFGMCEESNFITTPPFSPKFKDMSKLSLLSLDDRANIFLCTSIYVAFLRSLFAWLVGGSLRGEAYSASHEPLDRSVMCLHTEKAWRR